MIKILHLSDLHFDRPFDLCSPEAFSSRYTELKGSFSSIILYIKQREIDIALIAGDLFDIETLCSDTLAFIKREIASCPECHFFISPGDGDPYSDTSPYSSINWPHNVHIFKADTLEQVRLDGLDCDIYGVAVTKNTKDDNIIRNLAPFRMDRTNILVMHGETDENDNNVYSIPPDVLCESEFDYIALGHHHEASQLTGMQNFAYSGCVMGHGFDECGNKGALHIIIDNGKVTVRDVKFSTHAYIKLTVDVGDITPYLNANESISKSIDRKIIEVLGQRTKTENISLMVTLSGSISEKIHFNTNIIRKLVENARNLIIRDATCVIPKSPLLAGIKAGIREEAKGKGCEELTERAMKQIVAELM